ncbi:hypothetical protein BH20ACT6_BH20ACT6_19660 [soil metagenome]
MATDGAPTGQPSAVRRLDTAGAATLADLSARFEDLQTVLRCCEQLVAALAADGDPDEVVVEAVWTTALLSYARCFAVGGAGAVLSEDDLTATLENDEVLDWHRVLLQLRDHYADPSTNPRERFSVGVAQRDEDGTAGGVAITSARQPLVDDLTVRQTGAIAFALSGLVNDRIGAQQQTVFGEVSQLSKADLDRLERVDLAHPPPAG